jgi:protein-tyrosine-phosphatase
MAEALLRENLRTVNQGDIVVSSMGIHGLDRQPPSPPAVDVCREHGVDISRHRSRPLSAEELLRADLILVMEQVQGHFIKMFFPMVAERVFLLGSWPERESRKGNIKDPIGHSRRVYLTTFETIQGHIERVAPLVAQTLGRPPRTAAGGAKR